MKRKFQWHTFLTIMAVHAVAIYGVWYGFHREFSIGAWLGCFVSYGIAMIGISVGYHRFFTHEAFACGPRFQKFLATCGGMACQSTLEKWKFWHNLHHRYADKRYDPHRPEEYRALPGAGWFCRTWMWIRGLNWAHWGWTWHEVHRPPGWEIFMKHARDPIVVWQKRWYPVMVVANYALAALLAGIVGLITDGWRGFFVRGWEGVLLGGFIRQVVSWHATWSVNSFGHLFGHRPKLVRDIGNKSRNNPLIAIVAPVGESWHLFHHLQANCARLGWKWYQVDLGWYFILLCEWRGWVWDVIRPTPANLAIT